jgi:hypothetical protein
MHECIVKNILQMIYNYSDSDSGGELTAAVVSLL